LGYLDDGLDDSGLDGSADGE
nr:hypothetical protein [Tanacetum cinerariifolium]